MSCFLLNYLRSSSYHGKQCLGALSFLQHLEKEVSRKVLPRIHDCSLPTFHAGRSRDGSDEQRSMVVERPGHLSLDTSPRP